MAVSTKFWRLKVELQVSNDWLGVEIGWVGEKNPCVDKESVQESACGMPCEEH